MAVKQDLVASPAQDTPGQGASAGKTWQDYLSQSAPLITLTVAVWVPLIAIMVAMFGLFADLKDDIADIRLDMAAMEIRLIDRIQELDDRLSARIQELDDRLSARIDGLEARIDGLEAKIDAIGDMTVIAYTDGELTGEELAAIWERAESS